MKRFRPRVRLLVLLFFVTRLILGCSGGGSALNDPAGVLPVAPAITPSSAFLLPGQTSQFQASLNGAALTNPVWFVNKTPGGRASTGTISSSGLYTAPATAPTSAVEITVSDSPSNYQSRPVSITFFQQEHFAAGAVSPSNNPLVATYTINAPQGATAEIQFGTTTQYGLNTWAQPAPANGGAITILVAGMRANSTYHMQAQLHLPNGNTLADADHTFTTSAIPANLPPSLVIQQTAGTTPAPGVELLSLFEEFSQTQLTAAATDLEGNLIWYYPIQPSATFPIKLLPNGHMLVLVSAPTLNGVAGVNAVQEIDLAGNVIYQVALADLQSGLAAAGLPFPTLASLHHDMVKLPNGHFILLVNYGEIISGQPATVVGDALIDWDPSRGPVWTWSTFDHIPLSHAPFGTADWTHANAVVYSPDDGNLLLSMRNQNWIIKINYNNGVGDGSILWHLGPDGDFTLPTAQAPVEWNYAQHYPVLLGPNTAGIFPLMFFNNGNNRLVDVNNDVCGTTGVIACYSSVPIFQLNEYNKTIQVLDEINLAPDYSLCCGDALKLSNGDIEYDVALDVNTPQVSYVQESTLGATPQVVWQMQIYGQLAYRAFRIPSLYPGVEWSQSAIATANANARPGSVQKSFDTKDMPPFRVVP